MKFNKIRVLVYDEKGVEKEMLCESVPRLTGTVMRFETMEESDADAELCKALDFSANTSVGVKRKERGRYMYFTIIVDTKETADLSASPIIESGEL